MKGGNLEDWMPYDSDVIVVGSGAGGASFAHACAQLGKQILVLERGRRQSLPESGHDEQATLIDKQPYDDRSIEVNGRARRLYMGGVLGGGTALYGAALMRPSRDDFHPGKNYAGLLPRAQWDWPVSYETLEPYYAEGEALFGLAGSSQDDFEPLPKPQFVHQPLPLHPINQRLIEKSRRYGLRPFRLPLAIDPVRCLRCHACAGYICPTGARGSTARLLEPHEPKALQVLTNVEAQRLLVNGKGELDGVEARDRTTGRQTVYRARRYVLAAGAISSPLLLLRSGFTHSLLGRNYMMHYSPVVIGVFSSGLDALTGFVKQVGFADYYAGTKSCPRKLGLVQSLPVPGPLMLRKAAGRFIPLAALRFLRNRMLPLVGIIEDLPNPDNQVFWGAKGQPRLRHRFASYDKERGAQLARLTARVLKRAGATFCLTSLFGSEEHVAHQCGTLRFGNDAAHAVLDRDCRMFGHPSLFVVDGSFLPTSLGVGPALTIIANALRVARIVAREL
jgi:choline dehydrogenase-like flavoprotein